MINVDPYLQKLEWLKEWMDTEINRKGYSFVMNQFIIIHDFHRMLDLSKFKDFCIYKKYGNYKQSLINNQQ